MSRRTGLTLTDTHIRLCEDLRYEFVNSFKAIRGEALAQILNGRCFRNKSPQLGKEGYLKYLFMHQLPNTIGFGSKVDTHIRFPSAKIKHHRAERGKPCHMCVLIAVSIKGCPQPGFTIHNHTPSAQRVTIAESVTQIKKAACPKDRRHL